jgi:hypothetical protein
MSRLRKYKVSYSLAIFCVALYFITGCGQRDDIDATNFDARITPNIRVDKARDILGDPSSSVTLPLNSGSSEKDIWDTSDYTIEVVFINGRAKMRKFREKNHD